MGRVDNPLALNDWSPHMRRIRPLIALLLLVLFPAALMHCDLEAAGLDWSFLVHADHGDGDDDMDNAIHGSPASAQPRAAVPWFVTAELPVAPGLVECRPAAPRRDVDGPSSLLRTWRFEQRAAAPARAPGHRA